MEFTGLPGSGKTTLATHTQIALVARGMPCTVADARMSAAVTSRMRVARRVAWAAAELGRHPGRGVEAARGVRASVPASVRDGVAGTVQWLAIQRVLTRAGSYGGVQLLEEGPTQTLWTLALRSAQWRTAGVLPVLPSGSRADLLVHVEAPVDLLSARLGSRRSVHSRTQRLPEHERRAELERGRELLDQLLAGPGPDRVVVVNDGRRRPSELGRNLAEWVLRAV